MTKLCSPFVIKYLLVSLNDQFKIPTFLNCILSTELCLKKTLIKTQANNIIAFM
jgi:hypothetical protein